MDWNCKDLGGKGRGSSGETSSRYLLTGSCHNTGGSSAFPEANPGPQASAHCNLVEVGAQNEGKPPVLTAQIR